MLLDTVDSCMHTHTHLLATNRKWLLGEMSGWYTGNEGEILKQAAAHRRSRRQGAADPSTDILGGAGAGSTPAPANLGAGPDASSGGGSVGVGAVVAGASGADSAGTASGSTDPLLGDSNGAGGAANIVPAGGDAAAGGDGVVQGAAAIDGSGGADAGAVDAGVVAPSPTTTATDTSSSTPTGDRVNTPAPGIFMPAPSWQ